MTAFLYMNEKIENLLQIAANVSEEQREKDRQLSAGYNREDKTYEIIIKYSGDGEAVERFFGHPFVFLYNQYAVSRGTKEEIEKQATLPEVLWIEKPKAMDFAVREGIRASCINRLFPQQGNLTGKGILLAVIDSGIDIFHPDFINEDGTTRIVAIWDQTGKGTPPERYLGGAYYDRNAINEAVQAGCINGRALVPVQDLSGHGTHVTGIAAGNGRASNGRLKGAAPEADLLIVKLGVPTNSDFPRTTQVMTGVDFAVRFAMERNQPLVINLSFGNNYGPHDGTSLLETYLNETAELGKISIVTGMGNQGLGKRHTSGNVAVEAEQEFIVGPGERGFGLQIWKNYADIVDFLLITPNEEKIGPFSYGSGLTKTISGKTEILFYYGGPVPYRVNQEVYINFLPIEEMVDSGIWKIRFLPQKIVDGTYEMWLPDDGILSGATGFLKPEPEYSITIPATAKNVISVGAYDGLTDQIAPFSGRGDDRLPFNKPDLVAPGVNVESCAPGGGYTVKSGTSMAAPFVSGSMALLMQWGIVEGNDPFLYGEKGKAYLRKGARRLTGFDIYPNNSVGYGALCLKNSFPEEL